MAENTLNVHLLELMDTEANLTSNYTANNPLELGRLAFVRDSVPPTSTSAITRFKIGDGVSAFADLPWNNSTVPFGTCSTAAGTAAKTVDARGFVLAVGQMIIVKFTVTNTAGSPTLNVNGTGAKVIYYRGAAVTAGALAANRTYNFVYNGTQFDLIGDLDSNTTYNNASLGQGYGTCTTASATAAKAVTLSGYALTVGGIVAVKFDNAINNVSTAITMNINSKGAKPVLFKNTAITADIIKAGDVATFIYDGTSYHLISNNIIHLDSANLVEGILPVSKGGTGKNTLAANKILQGNGTNAVQDSLTLETSDITNTTSDAHVPSSKAVAAYVTNAMSGIVDAVVYKGTISQYSDLPTSGAKVGWAYKTTGAVTIPAANSSTGSQVTTSADGDTIILKTITTASSTTTYIWDVIPSGDEPSGTVTFVGSADPNAIVTDPANGITTSGTVNLKDLHTTTKTYTPTISGKTLKVPKITYDKYGRVTGVEDVTLTTQDTNDHKSDIAAGNKSSVNYEVVLNGSATDAAESNVTLNKTSNLVMNPSQVTNATVQNASNKDDGTLTIGSSGSGRIKAKLNTGFLDQSSGDILILNGNI